MVELVPDKDYPDFNFLGLLLGGRPYAAQHFTRRAEIDEENAETLRRGNFAKTLVASPEMRATEENPYNRHNQNQLWAQYMQGPDKIADMGNTYLQLMTSGTNQRENDILTDQLAKQRIKLTSEEELRVYGAKQEMDARAKQKQIEAVFGPDGNKILQQAQQNGLYEQTSGQKVPEGYDAIPTQNGIRFVPAMGGKAHQEMVTDYADVDEVDGLLDKMQRIAKEGGKDKAGWVTSRSLLKVKYKELFETGALDEGTLKFLDEMIPDRWDDADFIKNPMNRNMIDEQLRVLRKKNVKSRGTLDDKWMLHPSETPANRYTEKIPDPTAEEIAAGKQLQADQATQDAIKKKDTQAKKRAASSRAPSGLF